MIFDVERSTYYWQLHDTDARIVIEQGGTASGKTYTTLQVLFDIAMSERNRVITVVGQDIPNLKKGAFRDAKTIWANEPHINAAFPKPNESDRVFTCTATGSIIEFTSYQDEQDAKSGKRDYLFINEANGVDYRIFWQLQIRTKIRVFIDYNPTARFWAHDMMADDGVVVFYTDHRNNDFLTDEQHARIESIDDPELFDVYARGKTGAISGLIYRNWRLCSDMPTTYKWRVIGVDFGYNDPTAILDIRFADGELWVDELAYMPGMLTDDIAAVFTANRLERERIIADCAGASTIAELVRKFHFRVEPSIKGNDSVIHGINTVKKYRINVTKRSTNVRNEIEKYKWIENRNGTTTNKPEHEYSHAMDAMRYGVTGIVGKTPGIKRVSL